MGQREFVFRRESEPFPYWKGPYTPSRGTTSGFRVKDGCLGYYWFDRGRSFRAIDVTDGVRELTKIVRRHWGGGRVLFLPSGHVIKPLQEENEKGLRVCIGRYEGGFKLFPEGTCIDLSPDTRFASGNDWHGPRSIGLECQINLRTGGLATKRKERGQSYIDEYNEEIGNDPNVARGFRKCRPSDAEGRVRITVGRHVITNKEVWGTWRCWYVGQAIPDLFAGWDRWIAGP